MKLGIALSGGGIKSFSQLPVFKKLEADGIAVDAISGTSMGSVIAALVASGTDLKTIETRLIDIEEQFTKNRTFWIPSHKLLPFSKERIEGGFVDGEVLQNKLQEVFDEIGIDHISDVKIPLAIPSVDIVTGKLVVFVSHPELFTNPDPDWIVISDVKLSLAVRASCSFPIVISAVNYGDYKLIDGGVLINLPLPLLDAYNVSKKIAVTMHSVPKMKEPLKLTNTITRILEIQRVEMDKLWIKDADVVINIPLDQIQIFDIGKGNLTIEAGQRALDAKDDKVFQDLTRQRWYEKILKK